MEKKNPYITTIGFNREDSEHVRVANMLNEMGRGKAVYIVKAILRYEAMKVNEGIPSVGCRSEMDYVQLRNFVLQVIAEHERKTSLIRKWEEPNYGAEEKKQAEEDKEAQIGFEEAVIQDILLTVEAFRE